MKFSSITPANLANPANPLQTEDPAHSWETINFKDDVFAKVAKAANPDAAFSKISDFSSIETCKNDHAESVDFSVSDPANPANPANPFGGYPEISRISNFSRGATCQNVDFSVVRCRDGLHSSAATANDAYSWHSCRVGHLGWWGMAPHRCADWKAADHAEDRPAPDPLAVELATLANLDVGRMLAGDLTEADWPRITSAAVLLSERQPASDELTALVARIDTAYSGKVTS